MKSIQKIPFFFDEIKNEDVILLDSYLEQRNYSEVYTFLSRVNLQSGNRLDFENSDLSILLEAFHLNLTLESMRRRGLISISERTEILDTNDRHCEISLGPALKS